MHILYAIAVITLLHINVETLFILNFLHTKFKSFWPKPKYKQNALLNEIIAIGGFGLLLLVCYSTSKYFQPLYFTTFSSLSIDIKTIQLVNGEILSFFIASRIF